MDPRRRIVADEEVEEGGCAVDDDTATVDASEPEAWTDPAPRDTDEWANLARYEDGSGDDVEDMVD